MDEKPLQEALKTPAKKYRLDQTIND